MALLCDVVLAFKTALFQDFPHFGNGVAPGDGVQVLWMLLLDVNRGRYFLLTQQKLSAQEALELGAVSEVLSPEKLLPRAHDLAVQMAVKPTLALRYARLLLTQQLKRSMEDGVSIGLALEGLSAINVMQQK